MVDAGNLNAVAVSPPTDTEEELPRHSNDKESDSNDDVIAVIGEGTEKEKRTRKGLYYAVRVGYAIRSPLLLEGDDNEYDGNCDDDIHPNKKRKRDESSAAAASAPMPMLPMVKISSAIFLYWEDARQFINISEERKSEYAAFDSFEEAEEYLIAEERENALNNISAAIAIAAGTPIGGAVAVDENTRVKAKDVVASVVRRNKEPTQSSSHGPANLNVSTAQETMAPRGPANDNFCGGSLGKSMLNPHGTKFGAINALATIARHGQSVPIHNHIQTRESTNVVGKKQGSLDGSGRSLGNPFVISTTTHQGKLVLIPNHTPAPANDVGKKNARAATSNTTTSSSTTALTSSNAATTTTAIVPRECHHLNTKTKSQCASCQGRRGE